MIGFKECKNAAEVVAFFNNQEGDTNIYHRPIAISRNQFDRFDVFYENVYGDIDRAEGYNEEE